MQTLEQAVKQYLAELDRRDTTGSPLGPNAQVAQRMSEIVRYMEEIDIPAVDWEVLVEPRPEGTREQDLRYLFRLRFSEGCYVESTFWRQSDLDEGLYLGQSWKAVDAHAMQIYFFPRLVEAATWCIAQRK